MDTIHQTCVKLHQQQCAIVICVASFIGSANVLEFEYHREVGSVSGEVMWSHKGNATSVCPITGQHSLPFALRYPHHHQSALRLHFPEGERYGLTLFS